MPLETLRFPLTITVAPETMMSETETAVEIFINAMSRINQGEVSKATRLKKGTTRVDHDWRREDPDTINASRIIGLKFR